jgi:hypothetical protein
LDAQSFFSQRKLPEKTFYYRYNDQRFSLSSDYVISHINNSNKEVGRCLFVMQELNASDDFIVNVYLNSIADDLIEQHIRNTFANDIEERVYNGERVLFKLKVNGEEREYVAYRDDERRYHVYQEDRRGGREGWAQASRFSESLSLRINGSDFKDFERVDESEITE